MKKGYPDEEMIGHTFGRLKVLERVKSDHSGRVFKCLCVCGKEKEISGRFLRSGTTKSCGCLRKRVAISEGF